MMYPALYGTACLVLLGAAALQDLRERKISNFLSAALAATGLVAQLAHRGALAALAGLGAGLLLGVLLFLPWTRGGLGGGDLKLAAAAGVWLGFARLPLFILTAGLAGGAVAVVVYARSLRAARAEMRRNLVEALALQILPRIQPSAGRLSIPYAVAIAIGAVTALFTRGPLT